MTSWYDVMTWLYDVMTSRDVTVTSLTCIVHHDVVVWCHDIMWHDIMWHHIINFWAKGLWNLQCMRCLGIFIQVKFDLLTTWLDMNYLPHQQMSEYTWFHLCIYSYMCLFQTAGYPLPCCNLVTLGPISLWNLQFKENITAITLPEHAIVTPSHLRYASPDIQFNKNFVGKG